MGEVSGGEGSGRVLVWVRGQGVRGQGASGNRSRVCRSGGGRLNH